MNANFQFDEEKTIAALTYICERMQGCDMYKLLKILYFAEKKHLSEYGRPITGDSYYALPYGPVPTVSYDRIKDHKWPFDFKGNKVLATSQLDLDLFSDSDLECIEVAIEENQNLPFGRLASKSHDKAYDNAPKNGFISYEDIASAGGASQEMVEYIKLSSENQNMQLNESTW